MHSEETGESSLPGRREGKRPQRGGRSWLMILFLLIAVISGSVVLFNYYNSYRSQQIAQDLAQKYEQRQEELRRTREERDNMEEAEIPPERSVRIVPKHLQDFADRYPDFVGYLSIPVLNISYPVVQAANNEYYLERDINGNYSQYGTIYLDYRVDLSLDARAPHIVLYGHNMLDGQMFGTLNSLQKPEIAATEPQIIFDSIYGTYYFRMFATHSILYTEVEYIETEFTVSKFQSFIDRLNANSLSPVTNPATTSNRIITLITCNDYNYETQRFAAHGVLEGVELKP